ncbi:7196_t:CDS:1 [Paraglomus occultum]|uniref:7196_t:CDS:1 n=1 Tax=Paraglomus occultum TaxID=144539 RepID=A0A9N8VNV9_9GLOM|nr:7196_t:CDS:1 [Paraglomus occultum]
MKLSSVYDYDNQKGSQESLFGLTITNALIPLDIFLEKDGVVRHISEVEDFSYPAIYARNNDKSPPSDNPNTSGSSSTTHTTYTETNTNTTPFPSTTSSPLSPSSNPSPDNNPSTSGDTIPTPPPGSIPPNITPSSPNGSPNSPSSPNNSPLSSSSPNDSPLSSSLPSLNTSPSPSASSPSTPSISPQSSPPSTVSLQSPTARPYLIAAIPVVFAALIIAIGLLFLRRRRKANNANRQSNAPYMGELAALSTPTDSNRGNLRSFFGRRERNSQAFLTVGAFSRNNRGDVASSDSGRMSESIVQSEEGDGSNSYVSDGSRSDYRYDPSFTQFVC